MTDWQNISPEDNGPSPAGLIGECIACIGINACCLVIKKPKCIILIFAIIAFIVGGVYIEYYLQKSSAEWTMVSYHTNVSHSDSDYKTAAYINGSVWIYGGNNYDPWTAYIDTIQYKDPNDYKLHLDPNIILPMVGNNYANSVVNKVTNNIVSVSNLFNGTNYETYLVLFNPNLGSQGVTYYPIPNNKYDVPFYAMCIAINNDKNVVYVLGGYYWDYGSNGSISSVSFGEILIFDLTANAWTNYYDTSVVGPLVTNNKNVTMYSCAYYDDTLFVFGGQYYNSYSDMYHGFKTIFTLDLNNINGQWNIVDNSTLKLKVSHATAYVQNEDIYIIAGCVPTPPYDSYLDCYISKQIFNIPTLSVKSYESDKNKDLDWERSSVIYDYDKREIYVIDVSHHRQIDLYYFKSEGDRNVDYMWRAVGGIGIGVVLCGIFYYAIQNGKDNQIGQYSSINNKN